MTRYLLHGCKLSFLPCYMIPSKFYKPETIDNRLATPIRVGTFQEAHKIWKNLFHGLDIWVSKRPNNHEGDFLKNFVWFSESPNFNWTILNIDIPCKKTVFFTWNIYILYLSIPLSGMNSQEFQGTFYRRRIKGHSWPTFCDIKIAAGMPERLIENSPSL